MVKWGMPDHHLAQFNVARQRSGLEDPDMAEFVALLEPINALADGAPGFVWRLKAENAPDATTIRPYGDMIIINYSVWESREALWDFTYRTAHLEVMRRRREWFGRMVEPHLVMWWVPAGYVPTVDEAVAKLAQLRTHGPGPEAFTFRDPYPPDARDATNGRDATDASSRFVAGPAGGTVG